MKGGVMEESISVIFGKRIRSYRKKQKLSQEELAELCDLHPVYIGQLERGEKNASLETIIRVCKGLKVAPSQIFECISEEKETNIPQQAYSLLMELPEDKQKVMIELLQKATELI